MREIEFRGRRVDNKEWVYGYYCESISRNEAYIAEDVEDDRSRKRVIFKIRL